MPGRPSGNPYQWPGDIPLLIFAGAILDPGQEWPENRALGEITGFLLIPERQHGKSRHRVPRIQGQLLVEHQRPKEITFVVDAIFVVLAVNRPNVEATFVLTFGPGEKRPQDIFSAGCTALRPTVKREESKADAVAPEPAVQGPAQGKKCRVVAELRIIPVKKERKKVELVGTPLLAFPKVVI